LKKALTAVALGAIGPVQAHGFDERYDLPVPLAWVVAGACVVVALTFIAAVVFVRRGAAARHGAAAIELPVPDALLLAFRTSAWLLSVLTIAAALWGSQDPLMNLAPTLVWIVWWIGLAFAAALIDGVWAALDPWRTTFEMLDATARRLGRPAGIALNLAWPAALGQWPAVAMLLAWCWLEVVQPLAGTPFKLGCFALAWTVCNLGGMVLFGRARWQAHADVFALVFSTLGRLAPLRLRIDAPTPWRPIAGQVGFVMAMLASVVFDGLHGGAGWQVFEDTLRRIAPRALDVNGLVAGTAGLLAVWGVFVLAYGITLRFCVGLMCLGNDGTAAVSSLTAGLVLPLLPIALAYNVAHNFSSLVIQGQRVFALLSDPFGRQWDLFGTARWYPDIGLVDARVTWFVAVTAIVLGHMASVWWSHRMVLAAGVPGRRAAVAMLPMTVLMLSCTATSLLLIAEPMVAPAN
jgi:hypothetical protein